MFDFRRITLFCLEKRLSKHNITIFSKNLGVHDPIGHPLATLMLSSFIKDVCFPNIQCIYSAKSSVSEIYLC